MTRIDGRTFLKQAEEVLSLVEHRGEGPSAKFMFQPQPSLNGLAPVEALTLGQFDTVKRAAERFAER